MESPGLGTELPRGELIQALAGRILEPLSLLAASLLWGMPRKTEGKCDGRGDSQEDGPWNGPPVDINRFTLYFMIGT